MPAMDRSFETLANPLKSLPDGLQDLLDAMSVAELTEALGLRAIGVDWHVQVSTRSACIRQAAARMASDH